MIRGWSLGQVRGIPISLHWSLALVFFMLTSSLAGNRFPDAYPELAPGTLWLMAVATGVLFFASILLHELGHAIVAQRNNLPVTGITLFIFGGVATVQRRSPSAGVEFRVAAAGPLVTLVLTILFGTTWLIGGLPPELAAPAEWLAIINLTLLLFNLIPGYPLDGGRILRSIVWYVSKSDRSANRVAWISGRLVGFAMIGVGVYFAFSGDLFNGLWLAMIGWFVKNAAVEETAVLTVEQAMRGLTVGQAMQRDLPRVSSRTRLRQLVEERVIGAGQRHFVVADEDEPRGVLSIDQIVRVPRERWDWAAAGETMTPWRSVFQLRAEMDLADALKLMEQRRAMVAAVIEEDRLAGLLTFDQISQVLRVNVANQWIARGPRSSPANQPPSA